MPQQQSEGDPRQLPLPGLPQVLIQQTMHTGPLPPPGQIREYEAVYPGAAKSIFDEAQKNAHHIREMEIRAAKLQRLDVQLHRLLPFAVVLAFLGASVALGVLAGPAAGAVGIVATMAGVATTYLRGPPRSPPEQPRHPPQG
jgi:uncharacterized membrane protein